MVQQLPGAAVGPVLVVDEEFGLIRHVEQVLQPALQVLAATTVREALEQLATQGQLAGAVIDLGLPDGSGMAVAELVRERFDCAPILILSGVHEPSVINRAHALCAHYVAKPSYADNLSRFLRGLRAEAPPPRANLSSAVESFVHQFGLSIRESQILGLALSGVPRGHLADMLGVSENTIKTQVRSLLDKCGEPTLADAVWRVRRRSDRHLAALG